MFFFLGSSFVFLKHLEFLGSPFVFLVHLLSVGGIDPRALGRAGGRTGSAPAAAASANFVMSPKGPRGLQLIWQLMGAFFAQTFDNYFVIYVDLRQFTSIYMPTCVDLCQFTSIYVDLRLSMYKDGQGDSPNMLKQKHK